MHLTWEETDLGWYFEGEGIVRNPWANRFADTPLDQQTPQILLWTHLTDLRPQPHVSGKRVIVGHTPQKNGKILDFGHLVCLDTFCFGNGVLTAMDVHSNEVWQTASRT